MAKGKTKKRRSGLDGPVAKCPRAGTRVRFVANPAAMMLYRGKGFPFSLKPGMTGTITAIPVGIKSATCLPGPRGGMVYVDWDGFDTLGAFRNDLETLKK